MKFEYISDKGLQKQSNEDLWGNCNNIFWVLDGASVPESQKASNYYSAADYVNKLNEKLYQQCLKNKEISLVDILKNAISELTNDKNYWEMDQRITPCSTICILRIKKSVAEYLILGDSSIAYRDYSKILIKTDNRLKAFGTDFRSKALGMLKENLGYSDKNFKEVKASLVKEERRFMNKDNGYWVASFDPEAAHHSITGEIILKDNFEFLIFTDGFGRAIEIYRIYDDLNELFNSVEKRKLNTIIHGLRTTEKDDPNGIKYPRLGYSDDATCIYISNISD